MLLCALLWSINISVGQNQTIEPGNKEIGLNEYFLITIISKGEPIQQFSKFPDIEGFSKAGRSSSTTTTSVTGNTESVHQEMVQRYKPLREGLFRIKPFSIRVNDKSVDSEGFTIRVGPATAPLAKDENAEEDEMEAEVEPEPEIPDLIEIKNKGEQAFLNLSVSKKSVYTGEGVHVRLYFYLAFAERNLLEFHNFSKQLPELVKKIRRPNVWEEFFEQYDIEPENIEIEGKPYLRFKLYEAVYFPLTSQPLLFPGLALDMTRYKMLPHRSFDGPARVAEEKTYYSAPVTVEVKELPPHPLRQQVAVGNFRLKEGISHRDFKTRKGFHYMFRIEGSGNISSLAAPLFSWPDGIGSYDPAIKQFTRRNSGRISGSKSFDYYITPTEPGNYDFSKFAFWVYFNPVSMRYDTLRADLQIEVTGPGSRNITIANAPQDKFYDGIEKTSNTLLSIENFEMIKVYANIVLAILLLVIIIIYLKK